MVEHLSNKVGYLERLSGMKAGDTVLDIGSNDSNTPARLSNVGSQADRY